HSLAAISRRMGIVDGPAGHDPSRSARAARRTHVRGRYRSSTGCGSEGARRHSRWTSWLNRPTPRGTRGDVSPDSPCHCYRGKLFGLMAEVSRSPLGSVAVGGPRDVIDCEPWRDGNGRGRYPGEGYDVAMEMGLVDVTAFQRHLGDAMTCGE